jgi:4-amino-4-deoxy-L-arabinose transferase-like glycosyltransferase
MTLMTTQRTAFAIYILALAVRMLFIVGYDGHAYYGGITRVYNELAQNQLAGHGYSVYVDVAPLDADTSDFRYMPYILRPLGYAYLRTGLMAIGVGDVGMQVLQAVLTACSALLMLGVGRRMVGERTGVIAGIVTAVWPINARFDITLLPDALVGLTLLSATYAFVRGLQERTWRWFVLTGIAVGLSILLKPNGAVLAFFFAAFLVLAIRDRRRVLWSAALIAVTFVLLIPNALRNYEITGRFVPFGYGVGINLWQGLSEFGDTLGTTLDDTKMAHMEGYRNFGYPYPMEREAARQEYALRVIRDHPWWYMGVVVRRIPLLLTMHPSLFVSPTPYDLRKVQPEANLLDYTHQYPLQAMSVAVLAAGSYLLIILAIAGFWLSRQQWTTFGVVGLVPLCYFLVHLPMHVESRYFTPAIPHLILPAIVAVQYILSRRKPL